MERIKRQAVSQRDYVDNCLKDFAAAENKWKIIFDFFSIINPLERKQLLQFGLEDSVRIPKEWSLQANIELNDPDSGELSKYGLLKDTILDTAYFLSHLRDFYTVVQIYYQKVMWVGYRRVSLISMIDEIKWSYATYLQFDYSQVMRTGNFVDSNVVKIWKYINLLESREARLERSSRYFIQDVAVRFEFCCRHIDFENTLAMKIVAACQSHFHILQRMQPFVLSIIKNMYVIEDEEAHSVQLFMKSLETRKANKMNLVRMYSSNEVDFFFYITKIFNDFINPLNSDLTIREMIRILDRSYRSITDDVIRVIKECKQGKCLKNIKCSGAFKYLNSDLIVPPQYYLITVAHSLSEEIITDLIVFIVDADSIFLQKLAQEGFNTDEETVKLIRVINKNTHWQAYKSLCVRSTVKSFLKRPLTFHKFVQLYCLHIKPAMFDTTDLSHMTCFVYQKYDEFLRKHYTKMVAYGNVLSILKDIDSDLLPEAVLKYSPLRRKFDVNDFVGCWIYDHIWDQTSQNNGKTDKNSSKMKKNIRDDFLWYALKDKNENNSNQSTNLQLNTENQNEDPATNVHDIFHFSKAVITKCLFNYQEKTEFLNKFFDFEENIAYTILEIVDNRVELFQRFSNHLKGILQRVLQQDLSNINLRISKKLRRLYRQSFIQRLIYQDDQFYAFVKAIFITDHQNNDVSLEQMMNKIEESYEQSTYRIITKVRILTVLYSSQFETLSETCLHNYWPETEDFVTESNFKMIKFTKYKVDPSNEYSFVDKEQKINDKKRYAQSLVRYPNKYIKLLATASSFNDDTVDKSDDIQNKKTNEIKFLIQGKHGDPTYILINKKTIRKINKLTYKNKKKRSVYENKLIRRKIREFKEKSGIRTNRYKKRFVFHAFIVKKKVVKKKEKLLMIFKEYRKAFNARNKQLSLIQFLGQEETSLNSMPLMKERKFKIRNKKSKVKENLTNFPASTQPEITASMISIKNISSVSLDKSKKMSSSQPVNVSSDFCEHQNNENERKLAKLQWFNCDPELNTSRGVTDLQSNIFRNVVILPKLIGPPIQRVFLRPLMEAVPSETTISQNQRDGSQSAVSLITPEMTMLPVNRLFSIPIFEINTPEVVITPVIRKQSNISFESNPGTQEATSTQINLNYYKKLPSSQTKCGKKKLKSRRKGKRYSNKQHVTKEKSTNNLFDRKKEENINNGHSACTSMTAEKIETPMEIEEVNLSYHEQHPNCNCQTEIIQCNRNLQEEIFINDQVKENESALDFTKNPNTGKKKKKRHRTRKQQISVENSPKLEFKEDTKNLTVDAVVPVPEWPNPVISPTVDTNTKKTSSKLKNSKQTISAAHSNNGKKSKQAANSTSPRIVKIESNDIDLLNTEALDNIFSEIALKNDDTICVLDLGKNLRESLHIDETYDEFSNIINELLNEANQYKEKLLKKQQKQVSVKNAKDTGKSVK